MHQFDLFLLHRMEMLSNGFLKVPSVRLKLPRHLGKAKTVRQKIVLMPYLGESSR